MSSRITGPNGFPADQAEAESYQALPWLVSFCTPGQGEGQQPAIDRPLRAAPRATPLATSRDRDTRYNMNMTPATPAMDTATLTPTRECPIRC